MVTITFNQIGEHIEKGDLKEWLAKERQAAVRYQAQLTERTRLKEIVYDAPTIEERKTGKWIKESQYVDKYDDTIEILRCPICGFKHDYCQGDTGLEDKMWFNYCPNCGAKMEE